MKTFPLYVQDEWIDVYVLDRRAFRGCRGGVVIVVVVAEQIRREEKKDEGKKLPPRDHNTPHEKQFNQRL